MQEGLKDSGTVTAISVVGFVFGLIALLGAFIPCLGTFAVFVGVPAVIISGIGLIIARSQKAKQSFAIVALTISVLGTAISLFQTYSYHSMGNALNKETQRMMRK